MSDSGRIFMLQRSSTIAYGQDFLDAHVRAEPGFASLSKQNNVYPIHLVRDAEIIVGQNPDDAEESRALHYLGRSVKTAVFMHCQWEYYSDSQKANVARALETATIGITPAKFLTDRMRAKFPTIRWKTVDGCVDTHFFYPSKRSERRLFRRNIGIPDGEKAVLFAGRLESAKGTRILLDLCASARRSFSILVQYPAWQNVREKTALFQSYIDICEQLSRFPNVYILPDSNPRSDVRPVRFADIFISTSLSEVQPLVLLEAMASGVPFIGTRSTPGYAELQLRFSDCPTLSSAIEIIDLPDDLRQGAIPRSTVLGSASEEIANRMVEAINRKAIPDDGLRESISREFLIRGFTIPVRNLKFRQALEDASLEDVHL